jgi:hypothetical protein
MKTALIVSFLCLASMGAFAQNTFETNQVVCRIAPDMPKGARPVFPKGAYTALEDKSCPPCYEYRSKYGYMVMECPFLRFPAEGHERSEAATVTENEVIGGAIEVQTRNSYTGNYPAVCKMAPDMPKGAKPVFPASAYVPLQDPSCPPCYEYRSKYGYMVMECPYLRFAPENKDK